MELYCNGPMKFLDNACMWRVPQRIQPCAVGLWRGSRRAAKLADLWQPRWSLPVQITFEKDQEFGGDSGKEEQHIFELLLAADWDLQHFVMISFQRLLHTAAGIDRWILGCLTFWRHCQRILQDIWIRVVRSFAYY